MDALGHVFRHACDAKVRAVGRGGDLVEFLAELSVAEQKAQGGTQVVELLGRRARDLRIAGGVEPGEAAVQDEELAGRRVVAPAHEAGFFEGEGSALGAVHAHAGVALGVARAQGAQVVVVVVHAADEGGILGMGLRDAREREQQWEYKRDAGILPLRQAQGQNDRLNNHWRDWVHVVPPAGSTLTMLFSSEQ